MILITGCARSGTSLTAGILRACGLNLGAVNGLNEHTGVRDKIVKPFPDAKWVIVRRDKERIIDSCLRTHFMRAHKDRVGWGAWADGYIKRLEELKWEADCIEVWPDDAVKGDVEAYRPVVEFCGLDWNEDAVRAEINPRQWHG